MAQAIAKSIALAHPITLGDVTYSSIDLRRPVGRDLRNIGQAANNYDLIFKLAAELSGIPDPVFDMLDIDDIQPLVEVVGGFLASSQTTGKSS